MAVPGVAPHQVEDVLPLPGIDYLEFYVGNARQAAHYYRTAFGFQPLAYAGLETGVRDRASYALQQGNIRLVLTTPLTPYSPIAEHVWKHGDGVKNIALRVDDAARAWEGAVARGAVPVSPPTVQEGQKGSIKTASIGTYGETVLTFIERAGYAGTFAPGYHKWSPAAEFPSVGLQEFDHIVGNVELNRMNYWVEYYKKVLGFSQLIHFDDQDISTEYSALMSKVMQDGEGKIKFPINEPAEGKKKSQIQEYLDWYLSPGVQHIALRTDDILTTVEAMRQRGVEFLRVPDAYYDELEGRVGKLQEPVDELRRLGILVDRDEEGYLLQIFTRPVQDRPTVFFEVIQRKGSRGFGKGNFKALFVALEMEQARRGNL